MRKEYQRPQVKRIIIDKQISLVMMTGEGTPPSPPPFGYNKKFEIKPQDTPFKA
ncbi:MAG: hypothetical protein BWY70_00961 [Bacteroidetes bacterium ADurb.Bin408]|nr:MAG: hypothetical protein BWY70_00961 [Bacteroidetes bacterium ADurb.Bin408]